MQYFVYLCAPYCCILTEGTRSTEGRLNDPTLDYISYYQWLVVLLIDTYVDLHGARNRNAIRWEHALVDWNRLSSNSDAIAKFLYF